MRYVKLFEEFVSESKVDLAKEMHDEIEILINKLIEKGATREDDHYLTFKTPYVINAEAQNEDKKNDLGIVLFTDLISFGAEEHDKEVGYALQPWIACRMETSGEDAPENLKEIQDWFTDILKSINYAPFMDEDASNNHWKKDVHKNAQNKEDWYTYYTCFVNPDYPKGFWENHTIE